MRECIRKRGRPAKVVARRRRLDIRMSDDEYDMLLYLSSIKGKTLTDILIDGLRIQYEVGKSQDIDEFDIYDDYDYYNNFDDDE